MITSFLQELLHGFLMLWMNPIFYISLFLGLLLGIQRVRKERQSFHVRVNDVVTDLYNTVVPGIMAGFALSVVFLVLGFVLPQGVIVLLMVVIFLLSLPLRPICLTPSVTISVAVVIAFFLPEFHNTSELVNGWLIDVKATPFTAYFLLLAFLLIVEALMMMFQAKRKSSPRRLKSKRGRAIGGFVTNRLWLVPAFVVVPGIGLERLNWWPLFWNANGFSFMLVPFIIGFQQFVTFTLPERTIVKEARLLLSYSILILPFAILATLYEWVFISLAGIGLTLMVRLILYFIIKRGNRVNPFYFTERNDGVVILGIIPHTPAANMNLNIGEVIRKVNGIHVQNTYEFYRALQTNAAFCKLEVLDQNGEIRFEQRALYENEHHKLGLLFVSE